MPAWQTLSRVVFQLLVVGLVTAQFDPGPLLNTTVTATIGDSTSSSTTTNNTGNQPGLDDTNALAGRFSNKFRRRTTIVKTTTTAMSTTTTTTNSTTTSTTLLIKKVSHDASGRHFGSIGTGKCVTAMGELVRGKSRSNMKHAECREACQGDCTGYSYAPCEGTCTVHGSSLTLSESDGWRKVNGSPDIATSSKQCGALCFVLGSDCPAGSLRFKDGQVEYNNIVFGATVEAPCPHPYGGSLAIRCFVNGAERISGHCGKACPAGQFFRDRFPISYPQLVHNTNTSVPCPTGSGGVLHLGCTDGNSSIVAGSCGLNCVSGSVQVGDALVPHDEFTHGTTISRPCPAGFWGSTELVCKDGTASKIHGECHAHCKAGSMNLSKPSELLQFHAQHEDLSHGQITTSICKPNSVAMGFAKLLCSSGQIQVVDFQCSRQCQAGTIKSGSAVVTYSHLQNGTSTSFPCPRNYNGTLMLSCKDGVVSIDSGRCRQHCRPGSLTSNSIAVHHGAMKHAEIRSLPCTGEIPDLLHTVCYDGQVHLRSGMCGQGCKASTVSSNSVTVAHAPIPHDTTMNVTCPAPYLGTLKVRCYNTSTRVMDGFCGSSCEAGEQRVNGARLQHGEIGHLQTQNYSCPGEQGLAFSSTGYLETYSGWVLLFCDNGQVRRTQGGCRADCRPEDIRVGGFKFQSAAMLEGTQMDLICQNDIKYGRITLKCDNGRKRIVGGSCGSSCPSREFVSPAGDPFPATMSHKAVYDDIAHMGSTMMKCPSNLTGNVIINCVNGIATWGYGTCGKGCPGKGMTSGGDLLTVPFLNHNTSAVVQCPKPYGGSVMYECLDGKRNVNGKCKSFCDAGTAPIDAKGTSVSHVDMAHGETQNVECPAGYAGKVALVCDAGVVSPAPGHACKMHCLAGKLKVMDEQADKLSLEHVAVLHNETAAAECPVHYSGNLTIGCNDGEPLVLSGVCKKDCRAGNAFIYSGIMVEHPQFRHNQSLPYQKCPEGFSGTYALGCQSGLVSVTKGVCQKHCVAGAARVGQAVVQHGAMLHGSRGGGTCSDSSHIVVSCEDGQISVLEGHCRADCKAGSTRDENGAVVLHEELTHEDSGTGTCAEGSAGQVRVSCYDGIVTANSTAGYSNYDHDHYHHHGRQRRCQRHCPASKLLINQTGEGVSIPHGSLDHNTEATLECPGSMLGALRVRCLDGQIALLDGGCGPQNCAGGVVDSNGAHITHPPMNDGKTSGPFQCPTPFSGEAEITCNKGHASSAVVTLYDKDFDEMFSLCQCCELSQSAPELPVLKQEDQKVSLIAVSIGLLAGCLCAATTGYFFYRGKMKLAKGVPVGSFTSFVKVAEKQKRLDADFEHLQTELEKQRVRVEAEQLRLKEEAEHDRPEVYSEQKRLKKEMKRLDEQQAALEAHRKRVEEEKLRLANEEKQGMIEAKSEGGIKEKLRAALEVFVGVFTRIADAVQDKCDSLKERRARKKAPTKPKVPEGPREAGDSNDVYAFDSEVPLKAEDKKQRQIEAKSEGGIKEKLRAALEMFVGVFTCIADSVQDKCDSLKERRARKEAPTKTKVPEGPREAGDSEAPLKAEVKKQRQMEAKSEGGIKEKLRAALEVFVGVFTCIADSVQHKCDSLKERRARKEAPTKSNLVLLAPREAGDSEAPLKAEEKKHRQIEAKSEGGVKAKFHVPKGPREAGDSEAPPKADEEKQRRIEAKSEGGVKEKLRAEGPREAGDFEISVLPPSPTRSLGPPVMIVKAPCRPNKEAHPEAPSEQPPALTDAEAPVLSKMSRAYERRSLQSTISTMLNIPDPDLVLEASPKVGDILDAAVKLTLRENEGLNSPVIQSLERGSVLRVEALGIADPNRIQVKVLISGITGWISMRDRKRGLPLAGRHNPMSHSCRAPQPNDTFLGLCAL